ncbi:MAG TPA: type II toxin-antitoxin system PemK/MazF family toxin [Caulobacteraceae bacterium]|nr:type II toxin-antitoxin system PemK/MazF family toxin [Caulobacteraceae bacterium]
MRRGDIVTVAVGGDYGKPRPAVIVQTDAIPQIHASVIICQMTSDISAAADFRVSIEPSPENGLRVQSQIMADKPVTIRRQRVGSSVGRLSPADMVKLNTTLAFVLGLAD